MLELYCDGGVIGSNPSPHGGTWAWVLVDGLKAVNDDCGVIDPRGTAMRNEKISNNYSELFAAVVALEANGGRRFRGVLRTDSQVTLHRLDGSSKFNGIPFDLRLRTLEVRRARCWTAELLAGHPTKKDLAQGWQQRGSVRRPVSPWNAWCDAQCQRLAREFLAKLRK